ncbi:MAG: hypothetical protein K8I03_04460 [Ignavibacteria bacterium]|nr:hypothetical protein [Ignavibacteria bacterium]
MIKTSTFQIQIVCPGCNSYHAVSGIVDFDTCQNCGKSINVRSILNERMFGMMDRVKYINGFLAGSIEQMGGTGAYKLLYTSMPPECEECRVLLDESMLIKAIEENKPVVCPSCNHKMPVRKADAEIKEFHPKAVGVINDSHGKDDNEKNTDKTEMFVFKCMTCGAGLELTNDTKRTTKCNYCDNENYLPDSIWTKLHPNKEVQPLFLMLDLVENDIKETIDYFLRVTAIRVYSKHFENFICSYFEKPFVNESLLIWLKCFLSAKNDKSGFNMDFEKLHKFFYDNLILGLENHPVELKMTVAEYGYNIPVVIQEKLSTDNNDSVRCAFAKNGNLDKNIYKKLQQDKNEDVAAEAKKHKTGFLKSLFG